MFVQDTCITNITPFYNAKIAYEAKRNLSDRQFILKEVNNFLGSDKRAWMLTGDKYYEGEQDIAKATRQVIGANGQLETINYLPNNRLIDNKYAMLADQKNNFLLAKPFTFRTDNERYYELLKGIFDDDFYSRFLSLGTKSLNGGLAWLSPYISEEGEFNIKTYEAYEILPFWADKEHTKLDLAARMYLLENYEGTTLNLERRLVVYHQNGITHYKVDGSDLIELHTEVALTITDAENQETFYNWGRLPLIAFKYNDREIPLIKRVKSLQDGLNLMLSTFGNQMEENAGKTILILENYGGANLEEFAHNLRVYGIIPVTTVDGVKGGVKSLHLEANAENYGLIIKELKQAIISNGRGYDAKDDRLGGNPNQLNLRSMYSDIELDANMTEAEYKSSLQQLLWFVNVYLAAKGEGDYFGEKVEFIFNRDIMINESAVIEDIVKSQGILSDETLIEQHPWVNDPKEEYERLVRQRRAELGAGIYSDLET